ncbi:MAG TPA: hypothetical protein PKE32_05440 [Miltoncostaeaceae bacterium]|nr:hypothetical protein [Miltoncostaeaceae bacterium]
MDMADHGKWLSPTSVRYASFSITFHWRYDGERIECVGVDIRSFRRQQETKLRASYHRVPGTRGPVAITGSDIRNLPLSDLLSEARREARSMAAWVASGAPGLAEAQDLADQLQPNRARQRRSTPSKAAREAARQERDLWDAELARDPGGSTRPKARLGDDHYREVLAYADDLKEAGQAMARGVADAWGVGIPTANSWLQRARKKRERGEI